MWYNFSMETTMSAGKVRHTLRSLYFTAATFNPENETMDIEFMSGSVCRYGPITPEAFHKFISVSRPSTWFANNVDGGMQLCTGRRGKVAIHRKRLAEGAKRARAVRRAELPDKVLPSLMGEVRRAELPDKVLPSLMGEVRRADTATSLPILTELPRAKLTRTALIAAVLSGTDLTGVDLSGVNLSGVNLSGANLSGAKMTGANLIGANLMGANLSGANLTEANLIEADLRWANLSGADLSEADLSDAKLIDAILTGANLTDVILSIGAASD